jgi:alanine-synthesizing transaminase
MFSARTRWELSPNRLTRRLEEKHRAGRTVLDLTVTNPSQAGLACPPDVLALLADPAGRSYEPDPRGLRLAREAVAADYAGQGLFVPPDHLVLTASTSEAYAFLFKLLCDPGDDVLTPRPSYPLFEYLAGLESVQAVSYPLGDPGDWPLDVEAVRAALTPRSRAVVVVSPNNPTGSFLKKDEAAALLSLAADHGLAVIADEVFADYAWSTDPTRSRSLAQDGPALAFALGGLSKSCALPQLKLAWIAVSGPSRLRDPALQRLEVVGDTYLSVATPVQLAAPTLLARKADLQQAIRHRALANLATLRARLAGSPVSLLAPEGGWSAVLRVPATLPEEELVLSLLAEDDVLVHPGYFFDFPREAFVVVSLLTPVDVLRQGLERLCRRYEA